MTISVLLISSEKMTLGSWCLIEHERMKSRPRVDLPTPGRAATMIICPGCSPLVISSRSVNPVGTPLEMPPADAIASISSIVGCSSFRRSVTS
ncbi:Uncharacterised protein [Mycobacteroides abscessus subsp. abscessus]|nr:Uncharacterised protein [Mycobacteroides abscessus subsp. abscessus]